MYYNTTTTAFDSLLNNLLSSGFKYETNENYTISHTEDKQLQLFVNVMGHTPKNVTIDVTDSLLEIKAEKPEDATSLVKDIDYKFSIPKTTTYDWSTIHAKIENGLLTITVDKLEEKKPKRISVQIK
jgi:HSP20 family molecular chaperone IbpA